MLPPRVFDRLTLIPNFSTGHVLQWELDPFFQGKRPYNFVLQVSQTLDFRELIYEKELGDVYFTVDDTKQKQAWSLNHVYRLKLIAGDGAIFYSSSLLFGAEPSDRRSYAMAAEIIRKEFLACRYAGTGEAVLLKRKTYGKKESKNLDPVTGVPINDNSFEDYGTGLSDGFYKPVRCAYYIENSAEDKQLDPAGFGVKETVDLVVRMPPYPYISTRDIICDKRSDMRYSIMSFGITYFPGSTIPLIQKASMRLIPSTDTIYTISLDE